jgi:hypothetical protein
VSSPERVYALLVEANPIPDPRSVSPVPSLAFAFERRSVMLTEEPSQTKYMTARPRWLRAVAAFAAVLIVIGAGVTWAVATDGGPVAAGDARIEVTFTGDGTSYLGDRVIIEGTIELTYINEATTPAWLALHRYDTGSDALAAELDFLQEGENARPGDKAPGSDFQLLEVYEQGRHAVTIALLPGTYLIDAGPDWDEPTHVYRVAVIEVVAD